MPSRCVDAITDARDVDWERVLYRIGKRLDDGHVVFAADLLEIISEASCRTTSG